MMQALQETSAPTPAELATQLVSFAQGPERSLFMKMGHGPFLYATTDGPAAQLLARAGIPLTPHPTDDSWQTVASQALESKINAAYDPNSGTPSPMSVLDRILTTEAASVRARAAASAFKGAVGR